MSERRVTGPSDEISLTISMITAGEVVMAIVAANADDCIEKPNNLNAQNIKIKVKPDSAKDI
jgi:hypothetical protein